MARALAALLGVLVLAWHAGAAGLAQVLLPPEVIGMQVDDARRALLTWEAENSSDDVSTLGIIEVPPRLPTSMERADALVVDQRNVLGQLGGVEQVVLGLGAIVPDLRGAVRDDAGAAAQARGLQPLFRPGEAEADWSVEDQDPAPAALAGVGTVLVLQLAPPVEQPTEQPTDDPSQDVLVVAWPWQGGSSWLVAAAAALLVVALTAPRGLRARRERRWVSQHVRAVALAVPVPAPSLRQDGPGRSHAVRLDLRRDAGHQTLDEEPT